MSQSLLMPVWLRCVCRIQDGEIQNGRTKMAEFNMATMSELKQIRLSCMISLSEFVSEWVGVGVSIVVMYLLSLQEGRSVEGQLPACQWTNGLHSKQV